MKEDDEDVDDDEEEDEGKRCLSGFNLGCMHWIYSKLGGGGLGGRVLEDNSLSGTLPAPWARLGVFESPDSSTRPADDDVDLDDDDDDDDDDDWRF